MNVAPAVLYGGAAVAGIAAGAGLSAIFTKGDQASMEAHDAKLDGMSQGELRDAVDKGVREPMQWGLMTPTLVGGAVAGAGLAAFPLIALTNGLTFLTGGNSFSGFKGAGALAIAGAGLVAGGAAMHLLTRER